MVISVICSNKNNRCANQTSERHNKNWGYDKFYKKWIVSCRTTREQIKSIISWESYVQNNKSCLFIVYTGYTCLRCLRESAESANQVWCHKKKVSILMDMTNCVHHEQSVHFNGHNKLCPSLASLGVWMVWRVWINS